MNDFFLFLARIFFYNFQNFYAFYLFVSYYLHWIIFNFLPDVSNNEGVVVKNVQHDYHCSTDGVHCAEILRSVTFPLYNNRCTMFQLLSITKMRIDHLICVFSVWKDDFWWRGKIKEHTQCIASCTWISLKSPSLELPCKY